MERSYIAFISYRHKPLDMKVAEKLHKLIERYTVPKELRTDGSKHLGLVFRDRDELTISNSLTDDIYTALDNSRCLIVICTPDTPESKWVDREIEYFISKHGRENVFTVLADGTVEQSLPKILTEVVSDDGKTVTTVEPLSAYIVADSEEKVLKSLDKEFLRIAAALIGCPYDSLKQRQKRYRQQQISALLGIVAVIAAGFVGMLLNRNAEIARQLEQSLKNESYALSMVSAAQLESGDRYAAIESALSALPSAENDRPYSAYAEKALADALYVYKDDGMYFDNTAEQSTEIFMMDLSADGSRAVTVDKAGLVRCFDARNSRLLWDYQIPHFQYSFEVYNAEQNCKMFKIVNLRNQLIIVDTDRLIVLSLEDGSPEYNFMWGHSAYRAALSDDETTLAVNLDNSLQQILFCGTDDYITDVCCSIADYAALNIISNVICCDFSDDSSMFAVTINCESTADGPCVKVLSFSTTDGSVIADYSVSTYYRLECVFNRFNDLEVVWSATNYSRRASDMYYIRLDDKGAVEEELVYPLDTELKQALNFGFGDDVVPHIFKTSLTTALVYPDCAVMLHTYPEATSFTVQLTSDMVYCSAADGVLTIICQDGNAQHIKIDQDRYHVPEYPLPDINFDVYCGGGSCTDTQGICLVPAGEKNRIFFIHSAKNDGINQLETPFTMPEIYDYRFDFMYPFPSGEQFITFTRTNPANDRVLNSCSVYDSTTLEKVQDIMFATDILLDITAFSADGNSIIFENRYYDLDSGMNSHLDPLAHTEFAPLLPADTESGSEPGFNLFLSSPFAAQKKGQAVYTSCFDWSQKLLYVWKDTELAVKHQYPDDTEFYNIYNPHDHNTLWPVGQSGITAGLSYTDANSLRPESYFVYDAAADRQYTVENMCTAEGFPVFTVGNTDKIIASADSDGKVRIYNPVKENLLREFTPQLDTASIVNMQFILEDSVLAVQLDNEIFAFMDAASGRILGRFAIKNATSISDIILYENAQEMEIFLCDRRGKGDALCIDTQLWTEKYSISRCFFILPHTDTALCTDAAGSLISRPVYTTQELVAMGSEMVKYSQ